MQNVWLAWEEVVIMRLTEKQKKFCDYYLETGNAEAAARKAGYSARGNTTKLLQNTTIARYIKKRSDQASSERIADMIEVKELWTNILRGLKEGADIKDVLKASEYIAKTNGAFLDKVEHSGSIDINIDIVDDDTDIVDDADE